MFAALIWTRTSWSFALRGSFPRFALLATPFAVCAVIPAAQAGLVIVRETRFVSADGGVLSPPHHLIDDQGQFAEAFQPFDHMLTVDLNGGTASADATAWQDSVLEVDRMRASGVAAAAISLGQPTDDSVANGRSRYAIEFDVVDAPTRFRFEARASGSAEAVAFADVRRGLFEVMQGVDSNGAVQELATFLTLPPGSYNLVAEAQVNVFLFAPGTVSEAGDFDVLFYPSVASLIGDLNCDGVVSVSDIGPFVLAVTDAAGYATQFPDCAPENGDISGDGVVTVGDIGGFVSLVAGA